MSIPQNPLDKYASFSTHYVLFLGKNTESLRAFKQRETLSGNGINLNELNRLKLGEKLPSDNEQNELYIICDSRKISLFRINSVDFETTYAGGNASSSQIISGLIKMKLSDSSGIAFMNFLTYMADEILSCSLVNCFFLLKIFFVGHTHSGTTEVTNTSVIPMMLQNMSFEFGTASTIGVSQYDLTFIPTFNCANGIQHFVPIDRISSIAARGAQTTLGQAIDSLQNALNKVSKEYYDNTQYQALNQKTQKSEPSVFSKKKGRLVLYKISLPGDIPDLPASATWRDLPYTVGVYDKIQEISHKINDDLAKRQQQLDSRRESDKRNNQLENDAVYKAVPRNMTITDVLTSILNSCIEINRKASFKSIEEGKIISFKILTNITSNDETVVIHFDIVEHTFINNNPQINPKALNINDDYFIENENGKKVPKNSLEFDYVFSGKNTDIIDFAVKINPTAALFSILNTTKSTPDEIRKNDLGQSDVISHAKSSDNTKNVSTRDMKSNDMVMPPPRSINERTGYSNLTEGSQERTGITSIELAKTKQEYLKVLADIHGQSSLNAKLKIRGNSDLFIKSIGDEILPHVSILPGSLSSNEEVTFLDNSIKEYNQALSKRLNAKAAGSVNALEAGHDFAITPLYIKVNIYGPKIDPIFGNELMPGVEKFVQKYFYEGWYFVSKIAHYLDGNNFTQEFDMAAIEVFKSALITSETVK